MILPALLLGLGGSLHCAAMCGPLVFSVQNNWGIKGINLPILLYHGGRILGYLFLGLAFSFITAPVYLFHLQQYIGSASVTGRSCSAGVCDSSTLMGNLRHRVSEFVSLSSKPDST